MSKITNFTVGSDPEYPLFKNGVPVAAPGIIPGDKENKHKLPDGFSVEADNVAAEGNIPPCTSMDQFVDSMIQIRQYIDDIAAPFGAVTGAESSIVYPEEELYKFGCEEFGCAPTFFGYTLDTNDAPEADAVNPIRTFGCHIHLGINDDTSIAMLKNLTLLFDFFIGTGAIERDPDTIRRQWYGKAGEVRFPEYGIEYRVPGGFLLKDEANITWLYEQTLEVVRGYNEGYHKELQANKNIVIRCINEHNLELLKVIE